MADAAGGTDKVELKKLLTLSKKQPVNCGIGMTKEGAVMHLDRMKQPKALVKELEKNHKDMKNPLWGTAFVDMDEDPKLVILTLNKAASGIANKLKKTLKGTGFSKVEIRLEDGTVAEKADEEEEEEQAAATTPAAPATNGAAPPVPPDAGPAIAAEASRPAPPAAPQAAPIDVAGSEPLMAAAADATSAAPAPAAPDMGALTRQLTDLVKQMIPALAADPSRAAALKGLAVSAQTSLKAGDAGGAQSSIAALQGALGQGGATNGAVPAPPPAPTPSPAIVKARQVWVATRQKVETDLDKLHGSFASAFKGHGRQADLTKAFRTRVDGVLGKLDEALAHKLDAVNNAANPTERAKLVQEAHTLIDGYSKHVASDPTITEVDRNPFAPLALRKTITASLSVLSKSIS